MNTSDSRRYEQEHQRTCSAVQGGLFGYPWAEILRFWNHSDHATALEETLASSGGPFQKRCCLLRKDTYRSGRVHRWAGFPGLKVYINMASENETIHFIHGSNKCD